jgi:O-antigen ligase
VGWRPYKAHNGFIDILLDLGLLGLGIFGLNTAIAFWRSMKLVARERTLESQWPLLMLSLLLLYNVFEIDLIVPNSFVWVVYVAISVSVQRAWAVNRATERTVGSATVQFSAPEYEPCPQ